MYREQVESKVESILSNYNSNNKDTPQSNMHWLAYITWLGSPDAERMPDGERFDCLIFAAQNEEKQVSQLLEAEKKRLREEVEELKLLEAAVNPERLNWKRGYNSGIDAVLQKLS